MLLDTPHELPPPRDLRANPRPADARPSKESDTGSKPGDDVTANSPSHSADHTAPTDAKSTGKDRDRDTAKDGDDGTAPKPDADAAAVTPQPGQQTPAPTAAAIALNAEQQATTAAADDGAELATLAALTAKAHPKASGEIAPDPGDPNAPQDGDGTAPAGAAKAGPAPALRAGLALPQLGVPAADATPASDAKSANKGEVAPDPAGKIATPDALAAPDKLAAAAAASHAAAKPAHVGADLPSAFSPDGPGHHGLYAEIKPTVEAAQGLGATPLAAASLATTTAVAQPATSATPVPIAAIAVEIATQAQAGKSRFEIRLDPPDLGRIDVRLDVDRDGNVSSRLVVERQDTYDLLRRDSSQLERALQQAGLKTADNALQFSLRGHAFGRDPDQPPASSRLMIADDTAVAPEALQPVYGRVLGRGGLDIRV
jgi:flagellar hook-length control protein FliK